jgi:CubicO group peptidase (beta-lactamase class C family)
MVNVFKKIGKWLLILLVAINAFILISGKTYLYKGIANTYLRGRLGPTPEECSVFATRKVSAGREQKWALSGNYNKHIISPADRKQIEAYRPIAFLVIQNDSIKYEEYWDHFSDSSLTSSFSMGKTFVSILAGIAIDEGKIKSLDQPVGDFLPEFREGLAKQLTVRHLLNMSSGIDFDEDYLNPLGYPAEAYYGSELKKLTLKYKVKEQPGKTHIYLSGNTILLELVLEKATGMTISEYASEKLWIPMGAAHSAFWSLDHEGGNEKAYCCFNSNARDFARFGKLYLDSGRWNGKQLVSEEYVLNSIKPANLVDEQGRKIDHYGLSWWLLNYKQHAIFYARGILGQYIIVIPDKKMIIVRLGYERSKQKNGEHPKDLFLYIDEALKMQ